MRNFEEKRTTTNSSVYKKVAIFPQFGCPICAPNKGCNKNRDNNYLNWKSHRKTQWR